MKLLREEGTDMKTIALLGAGGKMGLRLSANLCGSRYDVRHVEISDAGRAAMRERRIEAVKLDGRSRVRKPSSWRFPIIVFTPCSIRST